MIPPKYNFYVGTADNLYFNNYRTIDDNGNITESKYILLPIFRKLSYNIYN